MSIYCFINIYYLDLFTLKIKIFNIIIKLCYRWLKSKNFFFFQDNPGPISDDTKIKMDKQIYFVDLSSPFQNCGSTNAHSRPGNFIQPLDQKQVCMFFCFVIYIFLFNLQTQCHSIIVFYWNKILILLKKVSFIQKVADLTTWVNVQWLWYVCCSFCKETIFSLILNK